MAVWPDACGNKYIVGLKYIIGEKQMRVIFTEEDFYTEESTEASDELRIWQEEFKKDRHYAWYLLGQRGCPKDADPSVRFLCRVAESYFRLLTSLPELEISREDVEVAPDADTIRMLEETIPFVIGSEYLDEKWFQKAFEKLHHIFREEIKSYQGTVAMYLAEQSQQLHVPERIFFHLVESKETEEYPFAFLATYATKNAAQKITHMPLQYALVEYQNEREKLLKLLACLNRASEQSEFVRRAVESGEMFHPLRLTAEEAYELLKEIPQIEAAGILCRIPNWWRKKAMTVNMTISIGEEQPSLLGFDSILSTVPHLEVDGVQLTEEEIEMLLRQTEGLAFLKGKWIEVDHARLAMLLKEMDSHEGGISLLQALRGELGDTALPEDVGALVSNGKWLSELLQKLRKPEKIRKSRVPASVHAELRPYQKNGYNWLKYMNELGFGACLADDMGLGKTLQVLTFLEKLRRDDKNRKVLLIVPASLLGNWKKEAEKFVPDMPMHILHGGGASRLTEELKEMESFLYVTTYGMSVRIKALGEYTWDCLILDEAQAIKNPTTKQTHAIKKIPARMRLAMTGTPIENDLTNLWSLYDFLNKGLLGSFQDFREYTKKLTGEPDEYARLRSMISPFMLRRLKTDKRIISDLPEKVETVDYVSMSKKQVVLYRKIVTDLEQKLDKLSGFERCGLILAALTHLKQVCNHPDQYLGQEGFAPEESGKWEMLKEICTTIYEKRERVLVFTQFREITEPLSAFLETIFQKKGFVLHGGTSVKTRSKMVEQFNGEEYIPYMVLSVKAGGTGLNLTSANHVIHFDRWWNPAVENQATDRAFRIGQKKNVMVHKLVCEKSIEEKIDVMLKSKKELSENVIGGGGENWITEMSNDELLSVLRLDA